jgi:hypothetical protein
VSNFHEPPYFLLIAGLLAGLASGKAFEVTLKQLVNQWSKTRSTRILNQLQGMQLLLPFVGISGGVCVFLASGLEIYGFPTWLSYIISSILTVGTAGLIWFQLNSLLLLLAQGGSRAIDIDAWNTKD